jgi:serine acetyltransferase
MCSPLYEYKRPRIGSELMYKHDFPAEITQSAKIYGENCWLFGCSTVGKVRTFN